MAASLVAVVVDCVDPRAQAEFWGRVLDADVAERNPHEFLVSDHSGLTTPVYFMAVPEPRVGKNRLHLDVITEGGLEAEVDRLVELGARLVEYRKDPDTMENPDTWAVLEDPEGNVFCASSTITLRGWVD
jgi:hypothetical protein